jgi:hypothetical protein
MRRSGQARLLVLTLLVMPACEQAMSGRLADCRLYRPHLAKRTFDGRVGSVLVRNAGPREVEIKVYHPDGIGDVELRRRVPPGAVLALQGEDGAHLALGNDWGVQIDGSCIATLGEAAEWAPGEFSLRWEGDSVRPGLGHAP